MHPYALHGVVTILDEVVRFIVKVSGSIYMHGIIATVIKTVEIMSYHLTMFSTLSRVAFLK